MWFLYTLVCIWAILVVWVIAEFVKIAELIVKDFKDAVKK